MPVFGRAVHKLQEMHERVQDMRIQVRGNLARNVLVFPESTMTTLGGQQGFNHARPGAMVVRLLCGLGVLGSRRDAECTQSQRGPTNRRRASPSRSDLMPQGPSRAHRS